MEVVSQASCISRQPNHQYHSYHKTHTWFVMKLVNYKSKADSMGYLAEPLNTWYRAPLPEYGIVGYDLQHDRTPEHVLATRFAWDIEPKS
jgi:hypothetical protein